MVINTIQKDWDSLAGRQVEFTRNFYLRLFERFPQYREMFPEDMEIQMVNMIEMFSNIAQLVDRTDLTRPYLVRAGLAHRHLGISAQDVDNFKDVFIETLARTCAQGWDSEHSAAWHQAFEDMIVPYFNEGLEATDNLTL